MKITAINSTQPIQTNKPSFDGKFVYDELNFLPRQLKEIRTIAKNFDISNKPYDVHFYNDPRDNFIFMVAEDKIKNTKCSVTILPAKQRPVAMEQKMVELIDSYDRQFIKPNTRWGKIKSFLDKINPFSI